DGGARARVRADPRRDDGHGRCLHGYARATALRPGPRRAGAHRLGRRLHGAPGGDARVRGERHQARPRVLDGFAVGLHDGRGRRRRAGCGLPPPPDARPVQGAPVLGCGRRDPRGRDQRHLPDGRALPRDAADRRRLHRRHARARRAAAARGLLLQGGGPRGRLGLGDDVAVPHAGADGAPGRLLTRPRRLSHVLRPGPRTRSSARSVIDVLARRRYGLGGLYAGLYRGFILGLSRLIGWIDRYLVDGVLNFVSALTLRGGDLLRRIQSGHAQDYVYGVAFGVLLLLVWSQWWAR